MVCEYEYLDISPLAPFIDLAMALEPLPFIYLPPKELPGALIITDMYTN